MFCANFCRQRLTVMLCYTAARVNALLDPPLFHYFKQICISKMSVICESNNSCVLKFSKILPEAATPVKGSKKAAGFDLKSAVECVVPPRGKALVDTGLVIQLPEGCYGRIAPRSGLAVKNFIDVGAGVVDEDYRGHLRVVLFNHGDEPFKVNVGDRIAQLICERVYYPELQEVENKELTETERAAQGFGSTGTK
ncbi:probable deoxyuridine 5'-triphosphate nucleotidohydrolase [Coccinella septempunctata]|uniref:probable deoxyuridine 5'-triphosphate nucleotidohydrolase n=1 Tax=Coccinella septempunctata TaxID=41139 RepID=UPI001D067621|nr:probable deoxyuridine 5'-triphosphate nucleotidohydrolase [Coccinella septempunctata]